MWGGEPLLHKEKTDFHLLTNENGSVIIGCCPVVALLFKSCREDDKSIENGFLRISRSKGNIISGRGSDFMQHLYGVSVRGKMLYFAGSISDDKFKEVEEIANQIDCALMEDTFCKQLVDTVRSQLGIQLNHQPIEYIFRVRKK